MKLLILLSVLVAMVAAEEKCSTLQRLKVKTQWTQAFGVASHRNDFARALFRSLFVQAPESRKLFERVNGDDVMSGVFTAHALRVLGGLDITISLLDNQGYFDAEVDHLKMQHDERGIAHRYFDLFKNSLMKIVPAAIGRCFDEDAWSVCYDVIANGIKDGSSS